MTLSSLSIVMLEPVDVLDATSLLSSLRWMSLASQLEEQATSSVSTVIGGFRFIFNKECVQTFKL